MSFYNPITFGGTPAFLGGTTINEGDVILGDTIVNEGDITTTDITVTGIPDFLIQTINGNTAIRMGEEAGNLSQGNTSIAIGSYAGANTQSTMSIAIGHYAGNYFQGSNSVAMGSSAAQTSQGTGAVSVGFEAGQTNQGTFAVSVGSSAGRTSQGSNAIALGYSAGSSNQGSNAVSLGVNAGKTSQGSNAVAVGTETGQISQGIRAVAIGDAAGYTSQGSNAVAVGHESGSNAQRPGAVAVGRLAGGTSQGSNAIAIGSSAGLTNQAANCIVINATGVALNNTTTNSCKIAPIRDYASVARRVLLYDSSTNEAGTNSANFVIDASNRVGIGTAAPSRRLHIYSSDLASTGYYLLQLESPNTDGSVINFVNTASGGRTYFVGSTSTASGAGTGFSFYDATAGLTRLLINASGNVGIGTTAPSAPLHVVGDIYQTGNMRINNGAPTITLSDTDHRTGYIHVNSNILYFLCGPNNAAHGAWAQVANGRWPLYLNLTNNDAVFGGSIDSFAVYARGRVTAEEYVFCQYVNMNHGVGTRTADTIFYSSTDDYIRKTNSTGMRASLNVPTRTGGDASGTWAINITGNAGRVASGVTYGSYGSVSITGTTNGWAGVVFNDVATVLMVTNQYQGAFVNNTTWRYLWNNGVLEQGSVPWARLTGIPGTYNRVRTDGSNMSHGSISVSGTTSGWAGIAFSDTATVFMANNGTQGVYINNNAWVWRFSDGTLDIGSVPWGRVTNIPATFNPSSHTHPASQITAGTFGSGRYDFTRSGSDGASICTGWSSDLGLIIRFNASGSCANRTQVWGSTSDERLKTKITDARQYLADLRNVRVRKFAFKDTPNDMFVGVIAQELQSVFPGLVEADEEGILSVKMSIFTPMLITAVQELATKNEQQDAVIADIQEKIKKLEEELEARKSFEAIMLARLEALERSRPP